MTYAEFQERWEVYDVQAILVKLRRRIADRIGDERDRPGAVS